MALRGKNLCKLTDGTVKLGHFERWLIAPGEGVPKLGVIELRDLQHCAADDRQVRDFWQTAFHVLLELIRDRFSDDRGTCA
jgi:hypothetical protein